MVSSLRLTLLILLGLFLLYKVCQYFFAPTGTFYTEEEMQAVHDHIDTHIGASSFVIHEPISPDIHVDIVVIPPTPERNYYTLVTMGMGAHRMKVPQELTTSFTPRAELLITLPPEWELTPESLQHERWNWPLRWLKIIARMPGYTNSWLAPTHTFGGETPEPLTEGSELTSFIIVPPTLPEQACTATLPGGDKVSFYQIFPLYAEELNHALRHGSSQLLDAIEQQIPAPLIISPARPHLKLAAPSDKQD